VEAEWSDENYGRIWLEAGPENPSYLKQQETTFALANTFLTEAERIRDVELARPLGVTQNRRRLPGPFADSKLSMVFITARIEGLRALFAESGFSDELLRAAQGAESPTAEGDIQQVLFELRLAQNRASELAEIPDLLGNADERGKAIALGFPLKSIQQMSARALGELTDLPVGFNASDGD
jgi:predicted lipoprotein